MKRTVILLLAMIIALSSVGFAWAATVTPTAFKSDVKKGDTVTVILQIDEAMSHVTQFEYNLYYDDTEYVLASNEKGEACLLAQISLLKDTEETHRKFYSVSFVDATSKGITVNAGMLWSLTFTALKDASVDGFTLRRAGMLDDSWVDPMDGTVPNDGKVQVKTVVSDGESTDKPSSVSKENVWVSFAGNAAKEISGNVTAAVGRDYTFAIRKVSGYDYIITATVNGKNVNVSRKNNMYSIAGEDVTGTITITATKHLQVDVRVNEYVKLDGKTMYLITVTGENNDMGYCYNGNAMYWSDKYQAYCYLTISADIFTVSDAAASIDVAEKSAVIVSYNGDVDGNGEITDSDVRQICDIYNARYHDLAVIRVPELLRADVNGDGIVNTNDAATVNNMM